MPSRFSANLLAIAHDALMAILSLGLALFLRLGERTGSFTQGWLSFGMPGFTLFLLCSMLYFRAYRHVWRYTSLGDLMLIAKAGTLALILFYGGLFTATRLEDLPRSVPFIHWMTLMLCLMAGRVLWRLLHDGALVARLMRRGSPRTNVLLIGATSQAEMFIRESQRSLDFPYNPVGILDDNPRQHGREIHHVRVYGTINEMEPILKKLARKGKQVGHIILSEAGITAETYKQLLALSEANQLSLARLPSLGELKAGDRLHDIRPVAVEDILGRPQATLDFAAMRAFVAGKRVLITGAGGSIGSELVRQVAGFQPASLTLYDISEYQLYLIDQELAELAPNLIRHAVIGDVRDAAHLSHTFARHKPEVVFHAAAIKHVPLSEQNPEQAVLTNVLGSKQVADACVANGVTAMVQISTDKAVNPLSVMGATKRAAEIYCQMLAADGAPTRFITVRFGNVLNSTGSVVPLFQKQIARGGPVTVTHKDMVRYFMSISEAVQLVLQAATLGAKTPASKPMPADMKFMVLSDHAPIYVLDMGEPVRIEELACQMIRLAGLKPYEDIPITFTGLRPGEKLFEELFHDGENLMETNHPSIRLARARAVDRITTLGALRELIDAARRGEQASLRALLQTIVPEYQPETKAAA